MTDPMADRPMTSGEARALLRDAVTLNIRARGGTNRFSVERDEVAADLAAAGHPANYADYDHPSEV